MKRYVFHIIAMLSVVMVGMAQNAPQVGSATRLDEFMQSGVEVSGLSAPYYDEEGNRKAQLYGGHAKILSQDIADIKNLRIDVYEKGEVVMTLFAPQCFTKVVEQGDDKILVVYSEGDVLLDMEQMTVSGKGFRFSSDQNRFEIFSHSKVLVKESARNMEGVEF